MTAARPAPDDAEQRESLIPLLAEAMCVQQGGVWRFVGEQRQGEYLRHARAVVALGWVPPDRLAALAQQEQRVRALHQRRPYHAISDGVTFGQTEFPDLCTGCFHTPYPCATIRALDATHDQEGS